MSIGYKITWLPVHQVIILVDHPIRWSSGHFATVHKVTYSSGH